MKRKEKVFYPENPEQFRNKCLEWISSFDYFHYFNHNEIAYPHGGFPDFAAAGCEELLSFPQGAAFESLQKQFDQKKDWLIGYLAYDLKNEVEELSSRLPDSMEFPDIGFYRPRHLIFFEEQSVRLLSFEDPDQIYNKIDTYQKPAIKLPKEGFKIKARMGREEYLEKVGQLIRHIIRGDFYEMNFCQEFLAEKVKIDPLHLYRQLCLRSPMPFSVMQGMNGNYLLCASPERFLMKKGKKLLSQPIKGTIRRGKNQQEDEKLKQQLRHDEKELAENMMIVDLVRNDLARSCEYGSVKADELFGIYSFRQVHQMISTVSGELRKEVHFCEALKNCFPMGSMTGAPKIKVMEMTEVYENSKRGLYSGAVGFITPEGDFDFNVVIRSILYNSHSGKLSFQVGGAITYDSVPEKEYEECLLKAQAIFEVLGGFNA